MGCGRNDLIPNYSIKGKLISPIILGRDIVLESAQNIKNFPADLLIKLEHIMLYQRKLYVQDLNPVPTFPEAMFINSIIMLHEEMNVCFDDFKCNTDEHNSFNIKY